MKRIIIIGNNHHNTLSMVRCIGKNFNDITLVLIGEKGYVAKSKYIEQCVIVKDLLDFRSLIKHNRNFFAASIIISCSDASVQILDSCRTLLPADAEYFRCDMPGMITELMDKTVQVDIARRLGFNVPQTATATAATINGLDFNSFPCIIKPNQSYIGGKHIEVCHNKEELSQAIRCFPKDLTLQIQQYITKKSEIVVPGYSSKDAVCTPAFILKHRDNSGATTFSTVKNIGSKELPLINKIKALINEIKYDGLFGFEFIYDGSDYYFIELNLRNDATCFSIAEAGVNLPIRYIESKINDSNKESMSSIREINSIVEFNDFSFVLRRELKLIRWIKDLKSSQCKFYYSPDDIKPFISAGWEWINSWTFKKLASRIRR